MKTIKLATLLLGAALFTGIGATALIAGMGEKCGSSHTESTKCSGEKKEHTDRGSAMSSMRCGSGKCGSGKCGDGSKCGSEPKESKGKCGVGKCG